MRTDVVASSDPAWTDALAQLRHDLYHLPGYQVFASRHQIAGDPLAIVVSDGASRLFVPLIIRPIEAGRPGEVDAVSSRFYPGPLLDDRSGDGSFGRAAVAAFATALRELGVVSAYLRIHPLLAPDVDLLASAGEVVDHMDAVSVDLTVSSEDQWQTIDGNVRREIVRSGRQGYLARVDADWRRLPDLVELYGRSMERLGALDHWRFDRGYFEDLRSALGDHLLLFVVERDGACAGAALIAEVDGIVNYHLAATADAHLRASPSKMLIDLARRWGTERGDRVLFLGASPARGDSLFRFKTRFSPLTHPVLSWRIVLDRRRYDQLTAERAVGRPDPGLSGDAPFFPAYRRGVV